MPAQICVSNFQPGGNQLLGLLINVDAGSNLRKQFSAGGNQSLGRLVNWDAGSNLHKQLSAGGAISYWDFS